MTRRKPQNDSSWRHLQKKQNRGKVTTKVARKRRLVILLRAALTLLLVIAIAAGLVAVRFFAGEIKKEPVQVAFGNTDLEFSSDGVLTRHWFSGSFPDIMATDIRDINVQDLTERLEAKGQVSKAQVTVQLPSVLIVKLKERQPILRMRLRDSSGSPITLLVARDGHIYQGSNYPKDTLAHLPGVTGLRVKQDSNGYLPITGLEPVAHLLDLAREKLPAVFAHWRLIDLTDWNPDVDYRPSLLKVTSAHIDEIIFSTNGLEEQISQLGGILERLDRYQMGQPKSIDLSFGDEAVIRWE